MELSKRLEKIKNLIKEYDEQISLIVSFLESSKLGGVELNLQKIELSKVRTTQAVNACKKAHAKRIKIYDSYTLLLEEYTK